MFSTAKTKDIHCGENKRHTLWQGMIFVTSWLCLSVSAWYLPTVIKRRRPARKFLVSQRQNDLGREWSGTFAWERYTTFGGRYQFCWIKMKAVELWLIIGLLSASEETFTKCLKVLQSQKDEGVNNDSRNSLDSYHSLFKDAMISISTIIIFMLISHRNLARPPRTSSDGLVELRRLWMLRADRTHQICTSNTIQCFWKNRLHPITLRNKLSKKGVGRRPNRHSGKELLFFQPRSPNFCWCMWMNTHTYHQKNSRTKSFTIKHFCMYTLRHGQTLRIHLCEDKHPILLTFRTSGQLFLACILYMDATDASSLPEMETLLMKASHFANKSKDSGEEASILSPLVMQFQLQNCPDFLRLLWQSAHETQKRNERYRNAKSFEEDFLPI